MPRKAPESIEQHIRYERWFVVQCLARNREYLALYEKHDQLAKEWTDARNRSEVFLFPHQWAELRRWQRRRSPESPPKGLRNVLRHLYRTSPERGDVERMLRKSRHDNKARKSLVDLLRVDRPHQPSVEEEQLADRIKALHRRAKLRFGVFHVWDPRPYVDKSPKELGRLNGIIFDSIGMIRDMVPTKGDVGPIDRGFAEGGRPEGPRYEDERFATFCNGGVDLYLIVDVRHPAARLRYDFERIIRKVERLKRAQKLKTLPERPSPDRWEMYLKVWDLRERGKTFKEIARDVLPGPFRHHGDKAKKLTHYYYKQAQFWITLDWARLG